MILTCHVTKDDDDDDDDDGDDGDGCIREL